MAATTSRSYCITSNKKQDMSVEYNYVAQPIEKVNDNKSLERLEKDLNATIQPYWYAPNEANIMATVICNNCTTRHVAIYPADYAKHADKCCDKKPSA
jgi:hypothetical protein